jgi:hypothetical protein
MSTFTGVGSPGTLSSASGGKVYAWTGLTQALTPLVAPANAARQRLLFHNPSSVDVFVYPQFTQNAGTNSPQIPSVAAPGGAFLVYANGGALEIHGECQGQWGAFARDSTGNACLTVMDSNV